MGCACGGAKNAAQDWIFKDHKTGKETVYRSEVQARAAQIRAKGGSYRAVPRGSKR